MFRRVARLASGGLPSTCPPREKPNVMLPYDFKGKAKRVYVTGASGGIGESVVKALRDEGYYVHHVSRWEGYYSELTGAHEHNTWRDLELNGLKDNTAAVIHLAGEKILKPHAGDGFYKGNALSRIEGLELLSSIMHRNPAETVVVASGVNYYPNSDVDADHAFSEDAAPGTSPLSQICQSVELAAEQLKNVGVKRVVKMRTGLVVGPELLNRFWWQYKLALGGTFGCGKQWMPWIEQSDLAHLYAHVVSHEIDGAVNAVSPFPIRNKEFVQAMANAHNRSANFTYPSLLVKAALGSTQASLLLDGPLVEPAVAKATHFHWHHDSIHQCLSNIIPEHAEHRFHEDHGEILY